jgi:hypothetical protein
MESGSRASPVVKLSRDVGSVNPSLSCSPFMLISFHFSLFFLQSINHLYLLPSNLDVPEPRKSIPELLMLISFQGKVVQFFTHFYNWSIIFIRVRPIWSCPLNLLCCSLDMLISFQGKAIQFLTLIQIDQSSAFAFYLLWMCPVNPLPKLLSRHAHLFPR